MYSTSSCHSGVFLIQATSKEEKNGCCCSHLGIIGPCHMKYYYCTCQPNVAYSVAIKVECNGWSLIVSLHHLSSLFNINYLVIRSNLSPSYRCLNCICVDIMNSLKQLRGQLIVFSIADHDYRYYLVIIRKVYSI